METEMRSSTTLRCGRQESMLWDCNGDTEDSLGSRVERVVTPRLLALLLLLRKQGSDRL